VLSGIPGKIERPMRKKIVITGIGVVTPIGIGKEAFQQALKEGKSGAHKIEAFDASNFSSQICCAVRDFVPENFIDKKKVRRMARFTQLGMAAAKLAIEDAGIDISKLDATRIGVITGTGIGGLDVIEEEHKVLVEKGPRRVSPFLIPMIITNMLPGEIAIQHGFRGPNYAVPLPTMRWVMLCGC
jgi:3-oxoacyl-[acyl-carrier-protein] synthase II